jgi:hypothetical protein
MQEILQLALLAAQAVTAANPPKPRARPYCVAGGVVWIALCLLTANGLLLTAAWLFLLPMLGPAGTPLALAGVVLIKAGAILLWLRSRSSRAALATPQPLPAAHLAPILAEAERMFSANKLPALTAALLAGLLAGVRRT